MSEKSIQLKTFSVAALLMAVSCSVACSNKDAGTVVATTSSVEVSEAAVSKAAAEAEAAEESMAAAKTLRSNPSSRKVASKESIYVVQVGTFKIESNAQKLTETLKKTGLPVLMKKVERADGVVLYTVRIEPTPSRSEAEKFAATIKSAVGTTALILSVGR